MNSPAAKIVAGMKPLSLPDEMAAALRQVDDLKCSWKRVAAYRSKAVQLGEYTHSEIEAADQQAVSIEMARRLAG
jgi:hypothetical protein